MQVLCQLVPGADPGEVKWVNFHFPPAPFFLSPLLSFLFLIPQTPQQGFGSITLLQKLTPHFKILDPCLSTLSRHRKSSNEFNSAILKMHFEFVEIASLAKYQPSAWD